MPDVDELGLIMTTGSLRLTEQTMAMKEVLAANDVRTLVANQLGVDVKRVTDEAHFTDDRGLTGSTAWN